MSKYTYTTEEVEPYIGKKILCHRNLINCFLPKEEYIKGEYYLLKKYIAPKNEVIRAIPIARFAKMECSVEEHTFYQHFDLMTKEDVRKEIVDGLLEEIENDRNNKDV